MFDAAQRRVAADSLRKQLNASLEDSSDMDKLHAGALPWLRSLPDRFQDELEGMAGC